MLVISYTGAPIEGEVLAGIEEEGVPFVFERTSDLRDAGILARLAADRSSLDVGVGIDAEGRVCILHEKLPEPLPGLTTPRNATRRQARDAGHNAARVVVGIPLLTHER
ncbi:MAG: glycerol dehydratase reactivase beta/small subunit family protein [Actinobacteria bacterium]|nr:glycerol dehydratase reactivase beta/small subunit family protein [Actinomycetota bacterium]